MRFTEAYRRLDMLLAEAGCRRYLAKEALADVARYWHENRLDCLKHSGNTGSAFFNYVVAEDVVTFTIYTHEIEIYILRASESTINSLFNPLALRDVDEARSLLANHFGRNVPDVVIGASIVASWLSSVIGQFAADE